MNKIKTFTGAALTTLGITFSAFAITGNAILSTLPSIQSITALTLFIAGVFILRAGLETNVIHISNQIDNKIQKINKNLPKQNKKEIDNLIYQLQKGNTNPGIGTKHISPKVYELRGRKGGRVYYSKKDNKHYTVLGYSDKKTQDRVISRIEKRYAA